jgi:hypothetical protein
MNRRHILGLATVLVFGGAGDFDVTLAVGDGTGSDSVADTVSCKHRGKKVRCN